MICISRVHGKYSRFGDAGKRRLFYYSRTPLISLLWGFFMGLSAIVLSEAAVLVFGETVNPFVIGNYMFINST